MRRVIALAFALALLTAPASAAQPSTVFLPSLASAAQFPQALPDDVYVPLPWTVLDSDEPNPIYHGGLYYFTAYRVNSGDANGGYVLTFDGQVAAAVRRVIVPPDMEEQPRAVDPVVRTGPARGSLMLGPDGNLYHWSFDSADGTGRTKLLHIQRVTP